MNPGEPTQLDGPALRQTRKQRGLTLQEVASSIGYNHSTLSCIENGMDNPGPRLWLALVRFYQLPPSTSFARVQGRPSGSNHPRLAEVCRLTRLSPKQALNLCVEGICDLIKAAPGAEQEPLIVRITRAALNSGALTFPAALPTAAAAEELTERGGHQSLS